MITIVKEKVKNNDYSFTLFDLHDDCKVIKKNNNIIGFIDYTISNSFLGKCMHINTIEVLEVNRYRGIGKEIIDYIFNNYDIDLIKGVSVDSDSVISFWKSNGATFEKCSKCNNYTTCEYRQNNVYCDIPNDLKFYIFK